MNTYILTLLAASLAAAVVELLSPKGEGGKLVSHVRMIAGLFLLAALLNPLKEGISLLRDAADGDLTHRLESLLPTNTPDDYEAAFGDALTAVSRGEVEAFVVSALETDFGIPPSGCTVSVTCAYEDGILTVTEVRIALHGRYMTQDPHPIEDHVSERLRCPCYVTVG